MYRCFWFTGGLTAVIYTDVLQCTIMIIGAIVLAILSKHKIMFKRSDIDSLVSINQTIKYTVLTNEWH